MKKKSKKQATQSSRRLTRSEVQKSLRRQRRSKLFEANMLELEQFSLFLCDFVLLWVIAKCGIQIAGMVASHNIQLPFDLVFLVFVGYYLSYTRSVFEQDLMKNNIEPLDKSVRVTNIIKLISSITKLKP